MNINIVQINGLLKNKNNRKYLILILCMISLLPTLNLMNDIYLLTHNERFEKYIYILQGGKKGELVIPISAYNPMAKAPCIEKLTTLINIKAEEIIEQAIGSIPIEPSISPFTISINLADDAAGGWTNAYTTHYDYTFKSTAFLNRNIAIVLLFSSQNYSEEDIYLLTQKTAFRYIYQSKNGLPKNLGQHIAQEVFVQESVGYSTLKTNCIFTDSKLSQEDYPFIFNVLYGDEASLDLNFQAFGNNHGLINPF